MFSGGWIAQKANPLFSKLNKSLNFRHNFQPLRAVNSEKLNKPQGPGGPKKNPFDELPDIVDFDDPVYSKYLWTMIKNPSYLSHGVRNFAEECKKFYKMKVEEHNNEFILRDPRNHVDMLYTFDKEEDVEKFLITSDSTNNTGYSHGTLVLTQEKTALFSGHINTEPVKTGNVKWAGFVFMAGPRKSAGFRIRGFYNWSKYTHLVLKVRGDGRTYLLGLTLPQKLDDVQGLRYSHPLYTRGGPYWQIAKIPFTYFYLTFKGRMTNFQNNPIALNQIGNFGITAGGFDGTFKLEIDYVGLEFDPNHIRLSPYEEYRGPY